MKKIENYEHWLIQTGICAEHAKMAWLAASWWGQVVGWFLKGLKLVGLASVLNNDSGSGMQKHLHIQSIQSSLETQLGNFNRFTVDSEHKWTMPKLEICIKAVFH